MAKKRASLPAKAGRRPLEPALGSLASSCSAPDVEGLFDRVAAILEQARASVVHAVNSQMVLTYWHIGREIVESLQGGDDRAEYGRRLID